MKPSSRTSNVCDTDQEDASNSFSELGQGKIIQGSLEQKRFACEHRRQNFCSCLVFLSITFMLWRHTADRKVFRATLVRKAHWILSTDACLWAAIVFNTILWNLEDWKLVKNCRRTFLEMRSSRSSGHDDLRVTIDNLTLWALKTDCILVACEQW